MNIVFFIFKNKFFIYEIFYFEDKIINFQLFDYKYLY